jgi:hypothetical protein
MFCTVWLMYTITVTMTITFRFLYYIELRFWFPFLLMYACIGYVMTVSVGRLYGIKGLLKMLAKHLLEGLRETTKILVMIANGTCFLRLHKNLISAVYNIQYLHFSCSKGKIWLKIQNISDEQNYLTVTENI